MTLQLSDYVQEKQSEVIAELLRKDGSLRLYSGEQRPLSQRTDGRIAECKITEVTVSGPTLTVKWDAGTATKDGNADYFRLVSGNIPVLSGSIPEQMEMSDRALKVNMVVDSATLTHSVFKE